MDTRGLCIRAVVSTYKYCQIVHRSDGTITNWVRPSPLLNWPQRRLAGVAEPSEPASGLIADVWGVQDGKAEKI